MVVEDGGEVGFILDHHATANTGEHHRAGEDHSLTQGTSAWARLGTPVLGDDGDNHVEGVEGAVIA